LKIIHFSGREAHRKQQITLDTYKGASLVKSTSRSLVNTAIGIWSGGLGWNGGSDVTMIQQLNQKNLQPWKEPIQGL